MEETAPVPVPAPAPPADTDMDTDTVPAVAEQTQPPTEPPTQNGTTTADSAASGPPVSVPTEIPPPPPPPPPRPVSSALSLPPTPAPALPPSQPQHQPQYFPEQHPQEPLQQEPQQPQQQAEPQTPPQVPQATQSVSEQPHQQVPLQDSQQFPPQGSQQFPLQASQQPEPQAVQQSYQQSYQQPQQPYQQAPQETYPPAPQQPQQQQHIDATPPAQYGQSHLSATTQPLEDALSLPPIHENHGFAQPPQQSQVPVAFGSVMALQGPTIAQYYPDMSGRISSPDSYDVMDNGRLGRSKKDVKRRTKTGCLTCRKRRIKCDERHPVCRNCEKSKRDCLGYDPIFKNQPGQSPLQPAPQQLSLLLSPQNHTIGAPQPLLLPPPNHSHNHSAPVAAAYSPPLQPATTPVLAPAEQQYDFSVPAAPAPPAPPAAPSVEEATPAPTAASQSTTEHFISTDPMANAMDGADKLQLRQANVEELFSIRGQICQPLEPLTGTPARIEDIKMLFLSYANGIDQLLECKWFETKALPYLLANNHLLAQYASLLDGFTHPQVEETPFLSALESREARIIWETMGLCRHAQAQTPTSDSDPLTTKDPELLSAVKRLSILEALITGATLPHNPVGVDVYPDADPSIRHTALSGQIKGREMQFWEAIGRYLVIQSDHPEHDKTRDHAVMWTRTLLDSLENRDIIYSILVVRHVCKFQPYKLKPLVGSTDEKDTAAKLFVALKFIEEENMGRATNQVVKRITGMVLAYWEHAHYTCG